MDQSLKELNLFYAAQIIGFEPSQDSATLGSSYKSRLFQSTRKSPLSFRGLAPPAFLVPAILDALRSSKYAQRTNLVPGEADFYCARAARNCGGTILTNDSDLLVYDLGPNGAVAFLSEVQLTGDEPIGRQLAGCEVLKASIWRPNVIAEKLGLPDLRHLAFSISQDPHVTMTEALQHAKRSPKAVDGFEGFIEEYNADAFLPNHLTQGRDSLNTVVAQCQHFDPRVSKFPSTRHYPFYDHSIKKCISMISIPFETRYCSCNQLDHTQSF